MAARPPSDGRRVNTQLSAPTRIRKKLRAGSSRSHPHREGQRPVPFRDGGSPAEYGAGMKFAVDRGWLQMHESGTFVKFTAAGAELFT